MSDDNGAQLDSAPDTYNGWANRETWAFWLWVTNDEGWYNDVREQVGYQLEAEPDESDWTLGEAVVEYVKETMDELDDQSTHVDMFGTVTVRDAGNQVRMMRDDIGSFWRIDVAEIGAAARELVSE
jgi:hypothetical protein